MTAGIRRLLTLGLPTGAHMTRYRMYHDIAQTLRAAGPRGPHVLNVARSKALCDLVPVPDAQVFDAVHPEYNLLHLHQLLADRFDYLCCDQVLEHVRGNPQQAIDESWRVVRRGGIVVHTTCVLNELHALPHDYWRFTPNGLAYLFRDFSRILHVGSWGHRLAFLGLRYLNVPHATWHPLHKLAMMNTPDTPIVTWIVAEK